MKKIEIRLLVLLFVLSIVLPAFVHAQQSTRAENDRPSASLQALERSLKTALSENSKLSEENEGLKAKLAALDNDNKVVVNLNNLLKNDNEALRSKEAEFQNVARAANEAAVRLGELEKLNKDLSNKIDVCTKMANEVNSENKKLKEDSDVGLLKKEIEDCRSKMKNTEVDRDKALSELAKALKQKETLLRDSALLHYNLGTFFFKARDYKKAVEEFRRSLELNPLLADAYYNLGIIYDDYLNDNAAAVLYYKKYLELTPNAADKDKVTEKLLQAQLNEKSKVDSPLDK